MMKTSTMVTALAVLLLALAGCTESPQVAGSRKAEAKAWDAPKTAFVAPGWKGGDEASWQEQMRERAQTQNEYVRGASMQ